MARQRWLKICAAGLLTRRGRTPPIGDSVRQSARRLRRAAAHTSRTAAGLTCTVLVALVLAGSASAQQDTWAGVERIVAVGDVHGDFDQFVKTLRAAEVVDDKNKWIAGKTHLVQLGDILGRGTESRKVLDLMMGLEPQAAAAGGAVHALIGNHEAMVLEDDWRYVQPEDQEGYGGVKEFRDAMSAAGKYGQWIRKHNTAIKINDLVFVHAGITPSFARLSLGQLNKTLREELAKGVVDGAATDPFGPLWDRSLALDDPQKVTQELVAVLRRYGASRMVVGHNVSREGVSARAGGRLIMVDVGMSKLYGGPAACLAVEKNAFYEMRHPKAKRRLVLDEPAKKPAALLVTPPARQMAYIGID